MQLRESRLKVERAKEHIAHMEARISLLKETDTSEVDVDPKTGCETLKHFFRDTDAFDDLALILGDIIHNLKCALDYAWLQTIERLAPALVDDRAKFPVRGKAEELKGFLEKAGIDESRPNLFRFMLDEIRPYKRRDGSLWAVHKLSNRDKHRLLIPVLTHVYIEGIKLVDNDGEV